jgi:RecJ-like exonuclease
MSKYFIDNPNKKAKYVLIRVDSGEKLMHKNRKIVSDYIQMLKGNDPTAAKDVSEFMDKLNSQETKCPECNGCGEFEIYGSHSFFRECENCNGTGVVLI